MMVSAFLLSMLISANLATTPPDIQRSYTSIEECVREAHKRNYGTLDQPGSIRSKNRIHFCVRVEFEA